MGAEVGLGVGSDTWTLRSESDRHGEGPARRDGAGHRSARGAYPTLRLRAAGALFALALGAGCGADPAGQGADAGPGASAAASAEALVGGAPLPARFETVGLADAVALASQRARP